MVGQVVACHGHGSNEETIQFEAHDDTLSTMRVGVGRVACRNGWVGMVEEDCGIEEI